MKFKLIAMSFLFTFVSCEKIPRENDLIGKWILLEQLDIHQTTLEFSDRYFIKSGVYRSFLHNQNIFYSDACLYSLDKKQKYMYLFSKGFFRSYKFSRNQFKQEKK